MSPDKPRDIPDDPKADINIRGGGWCLDWPSGGTVFPAILDGRLIAQNPTAAPNKSFLNEPKVNDEIDRISALPADQQPAEWAALDKMIMTDYLPIIPIDYSKTAYLHGFEDRRRDPGHLRGWSGLHQAVRQAVRSGRRPDSGAAD